MTIREKMTKVLEDHYDADSEHIDIERIVDDLVDLIYERQNEIIESLHDCTIVDSDNHMMYFDNRSVKFFDGRPYTKNMFDLFIELVNKDHSL